jgi:diguanylate cyclase (GGDEF)-like protein
MSLSETDIEIVKVVVREFLETKKSTSRRPLIIKAKSPEVLDRLVRWSILSSLDHQTYLPRALAFHFCGNMEILLSATQAVKAVASVLLALFPDSTEDKWFLFEELESKARKMFGAIDPQTIALGLYLAPEFNLLAGWKGDQAKMEAVRLGEPVVQIENPESLWDDFIDRQIEWITTQVKGNRGVEHSDPEFSGLNPVEATASAVPISQKIFLAHGHNVGVLNNVTRFLREQLGLHVVVLHELPDKGRTIIEKLEANAGGVGFAVVLLTPDDVGASKKNKTKLNKRARQNVILELGYFIGKLGRDKVAAVYVKDVELPSDFDGMLYVPYDRRSDWRSKLTREIKEAGIEVKETKFKVNEERANKDALTGLLDRRFFDEALAEEFRRAKGEKGTFSLVLLDLDNFKSINDSYGHEEGDTLLARIGLVLQRTTPRTHTLTRIGGDEFAVIASGLETEQACQLAETLRSALATDDVLKKMKVTGTFGVSSYPPDGITPETLIRVGDERLWKAKQSGGNRVSPPPSKHS